MRNLALFVLYTGGSNRSRSMHSTSSGPPLIYAHTLQRLPQTSPPHTCVHTCCRLAYTLARHVTGVTVTTLLTFLSWNTMWSGVSHQTTASLLPSPFLSTSRTHCIICPPHLPLPLLPNALPSVTALLLYPTALFITSSSPPPSIYSSRVTPSAACLSQPSVASCGGGQVRTFLFKYLRVS